MQRGLDFVICFYFAQRSRVQVQEQEDDDGQGREQEEVMEMELEEPRLPWSGCQAVTLQSELQSRIPRSPNSHWSQILANPWGGQSSELAPGADTPFMER